MKREILLWRRIAESLARAMLETPSVGGVCQLTESQHRALETYYHAANIRGAHHSMKAPTRHPQLRTGP